MYYSDEREARKSWIIFGVIIGVIALLFLFMGGNFPVDSNTTIDNSSNSSVSANSQSASQGNSAIVANTPANKVQQGRLVVAVTDAAANINGLTNVYLNFDKIELHSSSGWTVISNGTKNYDLLDLKKQSSLGLLVDTNLTPQNYDQLRLTFSGLTVNDGSGSHQGILISNLMTLSTYLNMTANKTSSILLDMILSEALHTTLNDSYVLAPVVNAESRENAGINYKDNSRIEITAGEVKSNTKTGVDINGVSGQGLKIDSSSLLEVSDGKVKLSTRVIHSYIIQPTESMGVGVSSG